MLSSQNSIVSHRIDYINFAPDNVLSIRCIKSWSCVGKKKLSFILLFVRATHLFVSGDSVRRLSPGN